MALPPPVNQTHPTPDVSHSLFPMAEPLRVNPTHPTPDVSYSLSPVAEPLPVNHTHVTPDVSHSLSPMAEPVSVYQTHPTVDIESIEINNSTAIRTITGEVEATAQSPLVVDRSLASAASLIKLLPGGTVFAFQALVPSFTNHGTCYVSNKYLTSLLIALCSVSCCFFSFTDSFVGHDGKLYYGLATFRGFYVLNFNGEAEGENGRWMQLKDLTGFRIRRIDYVHALLSVVLFTTMALGDSCVQSCFFMKASPGEKTLLVNLPLGAAFLSIVVFLIFPTSRKGIGYTGVAPRTF